MLDGTYGKQEKEEVTNEHGYPVCLYIYEGFIVIQDIEHIYVVIMVLLLSRISRIFMHLSWFY